MNVVNQTPQVLSPHYDTAAAGDFDPAEALRQTIVQPIFTPTVAGRNVTITAGKQTIDEDTVESILAGCLGDTFDAASEAAAKELLSKTCVHYDASWDMPVTELFAEQAGIKEGLPEPKYPNIYGPSTDIIPASKYFLAKTKSFDYWFASLAFSVRPDTFGVAFLNEIAYDNFLDWVKTEISTVSAALPAETTQMFSSFTSSTSLKGLTESLWLRKSAAEGNEEYSFARMLMHLIMRYTKNVAPDEAFLCPFSLNRLLIPESVVFINIEQHGQAHSKEIQEEWDMINDAIKADLRVLRPGQVQSLTATPRAIAKAKMAAAMAANANNLPAQKALNAKFKKTQPTTTDIVKIVAKVLSKMAFVNHSQNVFKSSKMSFARPNRRDPDDFNKQGRVVSTRYLPDIHLYVDTSGSITERQYQDAVKACIALARKLDINLYFNSFSHVMTTSTMLPTKGRSVKQIWATLQKVPKVSGGTDYEQIWRYIEASKKRKRELSLIITDFEYFPPTRHVDHPKNVYYLPISCSDWDWIVRHASEFSNNMRHIEPNIRAHILF